MLMADTPKAKRRAPPAAPSPPPASVFYVRGASPDTIAALDTWVAERREELGAAATDTASRRIAASFSRNDLVLDIIAAALKARAAAKAGAP